MSLSGMLFIYLMTLPRDRKFCNDLVKFCLIEDIGKSYWRSQKGYKWGEEWVKRGNSLNMLLCSLDTLLNRVVENIIFDCVYLRMDPLRLLKNHRTPLTKFNTFATTLRQHGVTLKSVVDAVWVYQFLISTL